MGLDFNMADAHWTYSGFNRFRSRLVEQLGCNWDKMTGSFMGEVPPDDAENRKFQDLNDPIEPLIMHSDCDGELSPLECAQVAPRLASMIADWPEEDYDKQQALKLIEGMLECVKKDVPLEFC